MKINYKFWKNTSKDERGYMSGMIYGYRSGDELTLAYIGSFDTDKTIPDAWAEELFEVFNIHRPSDYRGYDMSVGDVVQVRTDEGDWINLTVQSLGWTDADITSSPVLPTPDAWGRK